MQTDNQTLVEELLAIAGRATAAARRFRELPEAELNFKERPEKWSILECIEHLNRYGDFYLPEIQKAVAANRSNDPSPVFKSGVIGNYFAKLMKVENGKITKMPSPADKNPVGSKLSPATIDRFLEQQDMLTSLLNEARHCDLIRAKVPISLTRFIKLRLGDTFRFFVYHIERHVIQAEKVRDSRPSRLPSAL